MLILSTMNLKSLIIIFLVILSIGGAYYISLQQDTEVLVVEVTLARPHDNDSAKIISKVDASLSYVRKMEVPEETSVAVPGITVIVQQSKQEISKWYSVPIPSEGFYGSYTILIKLSNKIDKSRPVRILTRVVDPLGRDVSVRAEDIMLE